MTNKNQHQAPKTKAKVTQNSHGKFDSNLTSTVTITATMHETKIMDIEACITELQALGHLTEGIDDFFDLALFYGIRYMLEMPETQASTATSNAQENTLSLKKLKKSTLKSIKKTTKRHAKYAKIVRDAVKFCESLADLIEFEKTHISAAKIYAAELKDLAKKRKKSYTAYPIHPPIIFPPQEVKK